MKLTDPETIFIVFSELLFHPIIKWLLTGRHSGRDHEHHFIATISVIKLANGRYLSRYFRRKNLPERHEENGTFGVAGVAIVARSLLALDRSVVCYHW